MSAPRERSSSSFSPAMSEFEAQLSPVAPATANLSSANSINAAARVGRSISYSSEDNMPPHLRRMRSPRELGHKPVRKAPMSPGASGPSPTVDAIRFASVGRMGGSAMTRQKQSSAPPATREKATASSDAILDGMSGLHHDDFETDLPRGAGAEAMIRNMNSKPEKPSRPVKKRSSTQYGANSVSSATNYKIPGMSQLNLSARDGTNQQQQPLQQQAHSARERSEKRDGAPTILGANSPSPRTFSTAAIFGQTSDRRKRRNDSRSVFDGQGTSDSVGKSQQQTDQSDDNGSSIIDDESNDYSKPLISPRAVALQKKPPRVVRRRTDADTQLDSLDQVDEHWRRELVTNCAAVPPPWIQALQTDSEQLAKLVKAQAFVRRFLARKLRQRLLCANELVVTELSYVKRLRAIVNVFYQPMKTKNLVTEKELTEIFSVIGDILKANSVFASSLQRRVRNWPHFAADGVGDLFLERDFGDLYGTYIYNFENAIKTLDKCRLENRTFAAFLSIHELTKECEFQDLASLMIEPIQRLPRYSMLLMEMLKRSKGLRGTRAYLQTRQAHQRIRETTEEINAGKRQKADMEYAQYLYQLFLFKHRRHRGLFPESDTRTLIKDGSVSIADQTKVNRGFRLFFFNDALVLASFKLAEGRREKRKTMAAHSSFKPLSCAGTATGTVYKVVDVIPLVTILSVSTSTVYEKEFFVQQGTRRKEIHRFWAEDATANDWATIILHYLSHEPIPVTSAIKRRHSTWFSTTRF
eukprot:TRINITY_DN8639_c0_g1_i1.p1 TRINITY_DN8639_c0_g1~~TRINITY_DN8639_c0_g1_i1.p1  ORF type:complete len:754 (+),score=112.56 TRINITY_DN8639_c0_g1_i1:971-3232(+)